MLNLIIYDAILLKLNCLVIDFVFVDPEMLVVFAE